MKIVAGGPKWFRGKEGEPRVRRRIFAYVEDEWRSLTLSMKPVASRHVRIPARVDWPYAISPSAAPPKAAQGSKASIAAASSSLSIRFRHHNIEGLSNERKALQFDAIEVANSGN